MGARRGSGWLTMDDIVLPDHSWPSRILGEAPLFASGAQIWTPDVGIHSVTGRRQSRPCAERSAARGIDATGVTRWRETAGPWLLHEATKQAAGAEATSSPR